MKALIIFIMFFSLNSLANNFKEEAPKVADSLKKNLMGNLQRELNGNGVLSALDFCHTNIKDLAKKTATEFNNQYQFGRVSHKVRNPNNTPEKWMEKYLDEFKNKKQSSKDVSPFFHNDYYLEPLWVAPLCLQCHGENIAKKTSDEINKRYPKDQARGFKVGDFRGFIWVKKK